VLYDAADPYTRKIIIDKGLAQGIEAGSPVIDEAGVLGQVTRVHTLISEVTLVIDSDQAIPVLNARGPARAAWRLATPRMAGGLELRFMAGNADVQAGDLLTTSGVDGIYPAGLPVARVDRVERRNDSAFARIYCVPQGAGHGASHVMVLQPVSVQIPPRPAPEDTPPLQAARKGARKEGAMIMRPGQQLLLPANPLFIWGSLAGGAAAEHAAAGPGPGPGCRISCWRWCWCSGACTSRCAWVSAPPSCSACAWTCTRAPCWASMRWPTRP
jgi:hypothetical protein